MRFHLLPGRTGDAPTLVGSVVGVSVALENDGPDTAVLAGARLVPGEPGIATGSVPASVPHLMPAPACAFSIVTDGCVGALPPGERRTIALRFAPTVGGRHRVCVVVALRGGEDVAVVVEREAIAVRVDRGREAPRTVRPTGGPSRVEDPSE